MRLPLLRLPIARPSFDWLARLASRRFLLYALYTLVLFLIFMVVNFPHNVLVQRALRRVDLGTLRLDVQNTHFAWWNGYELRGVRLTQVGGEPLPLLEASSLYVRPGLDGLLRGELSSLRVRGQVYGGHVDASWVAGEDVARSSVRFRDLQVARYQLLTSRLEEGEARGVVSGAVTFEESPGDFRAAGEIQLREGELLGAKVKEFGLPDLHFQRASLKFSVQEGRLEIHEFQADGNEVNLSGTGQIALRNPPLDSVLNLRATIEPGESSPEAIRGLLELIPHRKGKRPNTPLVITGTVAKPRLR